MPQKYMLALVIIVSMALAMSACGLSESSATPIPQQPSTLTPTPPPEQNRVTGPTPSASTFDLPPDLLDVRLPALKMPTPSLTPTSRFRPPAPAVKETTTLELPVEFEATSRITPSEGGEVSLPDGARLQIPAGAVPAEVTISVTKLKYTGPESRSSGVYRIEPDDISLEAPATLVLPYDKASIPDGVADPQLKVARLTPGVGWIEVPAEIDSVAGTATVRTNHFSTWLFFWTGGWAAEEKIRIPNVKLQVPYYAQGGAGWCWAASTQMLLKYYGRDLEIWTIAEIFEADYDTALSGGQFLTGFYSGFFEELGFEVERSGLGWLAPLEFTGYIMCQLRQGRPIWVAMPNIAHAFLVVGYDQFGVYINDPSGYVLEFLKGSSAVDESHLNPARVSWTDWFGDFMWKKGYEGLGFKHTLVVLNTPPAPAQAVSMSVLSGDIVFRMPPPANATVDFENKFRWDGTKPNGHEFGGHPNFELPAFFIGLRENNPGNSDTLSKFVVRLANSTDQALDATVALLVDGQPLAEQSGISLPARTSDVAVDLMEDAPYSFREAPLQPGPHVLQLLLSAGGRLVDQSTIHFTMGPAQPSGLSAKRDGDQLELSWDTNPEERAGLADIVYVIWKDTGGNPVATVVEPTWTDTLSVDAEQHDYRVEAIDVTNPGRGYLTSVISDKVQARAEELICRTEHFPTGELQSERCYLKGEEHGLSKHYFESGQIKAEVPYVEGRYDGVRTQYNEAGEFLSQWTYEDYIANVFLALSSDDQGEIKEGVEYTYWDSGNLRKEQHYFGSDSNLHGPSKEYHDSEVLRFERYYENGKRHGVWKSYDQSGTLQSDTSWAEGKKDGPSRGYHSSGQLQTDRTYSQDQLDGPYKTYDEAGLILSEFNYVQDEKREGVTYSYYNDGVKRDEIHYIGSQLHGLTTNYYRSGTISEQGQWVDGRKDGVHTSFYESGALSSEAPWTNGELNGVLRGYYESGTLDFESTLKDGERHGDFRSFCSDGSRLREARYENGVQQEETQYGYDCQGR